jgi:hypothetical protein
MQCEISLPDIENCLLQMGTLPDFFVAGDVTAHRAAHVFLGQSGRGCSALAAVPNTHLDIERRDGYIKDGGPSDINTSREQS